VRYIVYFPTIVLAQNFFNIIIGACAHRSRQPSRLHANRVCAWVLTCAFMGGCVLRIDPVMRCASFCAAENPIIIFHASPFILFQAWACVSGMHAALLCAMDADPL
jgi:hypothetical protein